MIGNYPSTPFTVKKHTAGLGRLLKVFYSLELLHGEYRLARTKGAFLLFLHSRNKFGKQDKIVNPCIELRSVS